MGWVVLGVEWYVDRCAWGVCYVVGGCSVVALQVLYVLYAETMSSTGSVRLCWEFKVML